jgi:hypothetical protein
MPKLDASGKPIINGMNGVLDMSRPIEKYKTKGHLRAQYWADFERQILSLIQSNPCWFWL